MPKRQVKKLEDNEKLAYILYEFLYTVPNADMGIGETTFKRYLALANRLIAFEGSIERVIALLRVMSVPGDPHRVTRILGEEGNKWLASLNTPK